MVLEFNVVSAFLEQEVVKGYMRTQGVNVLPIPEKPDTNEGASEVEGGDNPSDLETSLPLTVTTDNKEAQQV